MSQSLIDNRRFINDIVHGIISLPPYIAEIIDTEQFQRLRSISQLSFSKFVYPSATNSRFEHCIGTFHLASNLIRQLQRQTDDDKLLEIGEDDVKCVEIAALCHDLGHGPYSHAWESCIKTIVKSPKSHEELSCEIFCDLVNGIKSQDKINIKEKLHLDVKMIDLIRRLIMGQYDKSKDHDKRFLFEIIANKDSGLDVDKFDYLCRDMIYLGWSNTNKIKDIKRIIHFFRVVKYDGEYRLAMRDREIFHIYDIFYSRHLLHRYGYQHKTSKAIDCMFKSAMENIVKNHLDDLIIIVIGQAKMEEMLKEDTVKEKEQILCSKEFIGKVCDYHIWHIMSLHAASIVNEINERNMVKLFCKFQIKAKAKQLNTEMRENICKLEMNLNEILSSLDNDKKIVHIVLREFSLSSEIGGDPILKIPFYKKSTPNECFNFDEVNQPSGLVNLVKSENVVMIFIDPHIRQNTNTISKLDDIKNFLCEKPAKEDFSNQLREIRDKFHFQESNY